MHFHLLKYVILSNYHVWVYQGELEHDEGIIMCGRWAARVRCPLDKGSCRNCRGIFKECGILHTGKNCGKTLYCTSQFLTNVCNSKCSEHFHLSHTQLWCCQSFKNKILKMKLTRWSCAMQDIFGVCIDPGWRCIEKCDNDAQRIIYRWGVG